MNLSQTITIHKPIAARDRHIAIFYLHGGGLLYGERDDLPAPYVRMLTDAGYTLVCADYPLAPECDLPAIVDGAFSIWRESIANAVASGDYTGYFLFGRSAGAYLSLLLAREICKRDDGTLPHPLGIMDFYGYHTLVDPDLDGAAPAYTAFPEVPRSQVQKFIDARGAIVTSGPKPLRYALYVHARQHAGAWAELLGLDNSDAEHTADAWSLSDDDVKQLPPLFITASSGDEDVPFRMSKTLSRKAKTAVMKPVYYLPHDFDRDVTDQTGASIYTQAIAWLDRLADA